MPSRAQVVETAEHDSQDLNSIHEKIYDSLHILLATGNLSGGGQNWGKIGRISKGKVQNV
jgi:hypothetical protein